MQSIENVESQVFEANITESNLRDREPQRLSLSAYV